MAIKCNYKKQQVFKNLNRFWENKVKIDVFSMKIEPSNWVPSRLVVCKTWFYLFSLGTIHVPPTPTILYAAPTTCKVKNYVVFGLQLQVLQ